jgi:hypothetical protein
MTSGSASSSSKIRNVAGRGGLHETRSQINDPDPTDEKQNLCGLFDWH